MMDFEWDEGKRASNLEKHHVDFIDAAKIFVNPVLECPDERKDYVEGRLIALGVFEGQHFLCGREDAAGEYGVEVSAE